MYVSSCSTPSFSSPANSAIPGGGGKALLASLPVVPLLKIDINTSMSVEIYHGCVYDGFWPSVPWRSYRGCAEDWEHGWVYGGKKRPIVWCVCDRDDCNVMMRTATPKSTTTQSTITATDDLTTDVTQVPRAIQHAVEKLNSDVHGRAQAGARGCTCTPLDSDLKIICNVVLLQ